MLAQETGEYVHGEFHATASTGGEIALYNIDGNARVLAADERLVVTDVLVAHDNGGDVAVYLDKDDDNTLDAGETVIRVPASANGGAAFNFAGIPRWGAEGAKPHVVCPSGTIDAILTGFIF